MDKRIRRNEICAIGLPRCDFVFSSTRTCFIAYGFQKSPLEKAILSRVLTERGIQAVEASGALAPGQSAFCSKICSKIITSQFCVVLLNNDAAEGREIPNANVNMEYGLMLGFNKYVLPFQHASQRLPFNVAGLDTIKYESIDFESRAIAAVDQAIRETLQDTPRRPPSPDQVLRVFLLTKKALLTPINNDGDRNIYQLGAPLGFQLANDFAGMNYIFLGNFTAFRPEVIMWRVNMLLEIIDGRRAAFPLKIKAGLGTAEQANIFEKLLDDIRIWIVVTSPEDRTTIENALGQQRYKIEVFSLNDIKSALESLH
jgi:hypothetical protein